MKKKILLLHGPNLNLLGKREPEIYGKNSIEKINKEITDYAEKKGILLEIHQSNNEGEIIDLIHQKMEYDGMVINPGAYTHTSIAIADAIRAAGLPCVEVHLSNIHSREEYRKISYIAPACIGQISGFGSYSYFLGVDALINFLNEQR